MGIAVTPDGSRVAVGVYQSSGSTLEIIDAANLATIWSVGIGVRPFQVVAAHDGRHVYSIDHDSYTVTVVDLEAGNAHHLSAICSGVGRSTSRTTPLSGRTARCCWRTRAGASSDSGSGLWF